jgi:hypothetical protein
MQMPRDGFAGTLPGLAATVVVLAIAAGAAAAKPATATARAPATMVIGRQAGDSEVVLDLDVTAFRPPRHGAVEVVVTLQADGGGREVGVGSFAIYPSRKFKARKPGDARAFRLDAMQALTDLGLQATTVRLRLSFAPLHHGATAAGAKLTLGTARFVPRDGAGGDGDTNATSIGGGDNEHHDTGNDK